MDNIDKLRELTQVAMSLVEHDGKHTSKQIARILDPKRPAASKAEWLTFHHEQSHRQLQVILTLMEIEDVLREEIEARRPSG